MAFVDKAVKECPEPAEIIALYWKKSGRQPSGELPADKLERLYQALHTEWEKARIASRYNEQLVKINKDSLNIAWQLYNVHIPAVEGGAGAQLEPKDEAGSMGQR